jgi:hypothetical protein
MSKYHQGKFKPKNPEKYVGDPNNIIYRSSWELKLCRYLDDHPDVLEWGSEEFSIPYVINNKARRYFPDFWVRKINKEGIEEILVIEVKPMAQTVPPKPPKDKKLTKRFLREAKTWQVNSAKWKYAEEFCKKRGWKFVKFTENELGVK